MIAGTLLSGEPYRYKLFSPILLFIFFCIPASAANLTDSPRTFIIGGDFYYPPYEYLDKSGNPTGYNVELTRAIGEVMGINVEIRLGAWNEMRNALESGEIDALQGIVFTDERKDKYDFTPHHAIIHQSIFHRQGSPKAKGMDSLRGKEVIVQNAGSMHDNFLKMGLDIRLITTDTHADALRLLASGKHDYAVVANLPGSYLGRELHLSNIVKSGKPIKSFRYCYGVKKGNSDLLALLNEGLSILKNTGRHQEIYDKWLGTYEPRSISWDRIVKLGLLVIPPLLFIMIAIVVWNRTLKKEVFLRTDEIYQQQQQLIQADKMSTLGILVSGVAHEINNPNSLILLNTPVIKEAYEDLGPILESHFNRHGDFMLGGLEYSRMREEIPSMLEDMLAGARRIKRIVDDLKDYARIEDAEGAETVHINEVVRTAVRLVDNTIKKTTGNFHLTCATNLRPVRGCSQRIEQVILNLILNACQALDAYEKSVFLKTFNSRDGRFVVVKIKDEGTGIAEEDLSHLTDPFFTTKRETGGTGLGLSVSATIVKEHKGSIDFTSEPGKGTTVVLSLPVSKENSH